VLAALQYRWTGEIGRAEADRQRTRLERAAQRFARELGRELGQATMAFRPEPPGRGSVDPRVSLLERFERWQTAEHAALVSRLVLVTFPDSGPAVAEAADVERLEFVEVPFPSQLEPFRKQLEGGRLRREGFRPGAFLPTPLAFVMPVIQPGAGASPRHRPGAFQLSGVALIELDEVYVREALLPELAEIHFGPLDEGDYVVAVLNRRDNSMLYSSDPELGPDELARADVRLDLAARPGWPGSPRDRLDRGFRFGGRPPSGSRMPGLRPDEAGPARTPDGSRRGGPAERALGDGPAPPWHDLPLEARGGGPGGAGGPWVLVLRHRGGSLAEAVAAVRRRNLAVGLGVLALLGTAAALLAVGGQRARYLARQQLEFVAGVTHELHTPLAAIRSAGQNLADGVVSDPQQIRRYGDLIQKEGGRLGALVAQVLDFAGIESGARAYSTELVAVGPLVHKAVGDLGLVLEQAGMKVEIDVEDGLPEILGDAEALGRALENLLTNAAKFAGAGGWVRVSARRGSGAENITLGVEDRGPGIPKTEGRRVFEPFFRGRGARQSQAAGSGLGLSLVRHVAEAHGGRVRVEPRDEEGTMVVMELPIAREPPEEST
jgi:signal transduction histidine kinase